VLEEHLPFLTSASVETRELLHGHASDQSWVSTRRGSGQMQVDVAARAPGHRLSLQTPVPSPFGIRSQGEGSRVVWTSLLSLALLFVGTIVCVGWIMKYLLRHVLLADIVDPARPTQLVEPTVGQHMLVICDDPMAYVKLLMGVSEITPQPAALPAATGAAPDGTPAATPAEMPPATGPNEKPSDAAVFELTPILTADNPAAKWREARAALGSMSTVVPLVIPDVSTDIYNLPLLFKKLALVDQLMGDLEQTVVLLSKYPAHVLAAAAKEAAQGKADSERWPKLILRLLAIDARSSPDDAKRSNDTQATISWLGRPAQLWTAWTRPQTARWQTELTRREAGRNRRLLRICEELEKTSAFQSGELTCDQILEELAERAAPYYQRIWQACDADERVVLEHVAQYGLVSAASRRVVRRLLGKGLLRKDPDLRLMSQSFQRFVLTAECRREVARLEDLAEPSVWDRLRLPLGLTALTTVLFLVITQREAFDATVAMAAGVTTAVPTLVRLTNFLTQLGGKPNAPSTGTA
jgi:hypothetical protein